MNQSCKQFHEIPHVQSFSKAEFSTKKVARPFAAWVNQNNFALGDAIDHAYCIPNDREVEADYLLHQRMQTADRYGGYGVGYCGGSARCGIYGDVQVKGVGLTPLIGSRPGSPSDPMHSSGTVTMMEAGREAIWSGICGFALPHGVVPTQAIVLTGTQCFRTDLDPTVEVLARRALLMRAVALRPAHFLRNVHFPTPVVPGAGACADYLRVQQMVRTLPAAFDQMFGAEISRGTATARVNAGLAVMVRRFAAQVTAAFAKRLYHGSLNCTNIALDGRYLDFGTMTAVKGYRRLAAFPLWPDQWTQHTPLLRTLSYLLFNVAKHLDCPDIKAILSAKDLTAEFNTALSHRTEIEFLKLTGIPEHVVAVYPQAQRSRAYRCLKTLYSRGADTPYYVRADEDPNMIGIEPLHSTGHYDLNEILAKAAQCPDVTQLRESMDELIDDASLAAEFHGVHTDLKNGFLSMHPGMDAMVANQFLARQAARLNADVSHLNREVLNDAMAVFENDPSGLGAYIDTTIRQAKEILDDEPPAIVDSQGNGITGLDAQLNALRQMSRHDAAALFAASPLRCVTAETSTKLGALCSIA